ncbi:MAG: prepilin-type N-terminal cleavage/methylation domain-containing protein [Gammaproteobacteria bacterium]|nr:prepilin-type N-terminal cleavage/methylation domain-containing protein [Gammaproteobacteria bacterium]
MNSKFKTNSKSNGFSLIEVMVALLVLALGILGISKLQGTLIQNSSNANQRTTATSIAQQKIDDLKSFPHLTVGTATDAVPDTWVAGIAAANLAYEHIEANKGGTITDGAVTVGTTDYTLNWTVADYWYAAALTAATTTEPVPAPSTSDFKVVTVTVQWNDERGDTQTISLNTAIDSYRPALTEFSDTTNNIGDVGPKANYTPLPAPDVVPVSLESGGEKFKETSVPEPEVTKQDYATTVDFETVTYVKQLTDSFATRREEFVTTACSCNKVTGSNVSHTYGYLEWDVEDEQFVDATYTVVNNNADTEDYAGAADIEECRICCRDGQYNVAATDGPLTAQLQKFGFNNTDKTTAGQVDKACRLKRIDGIYRVVKPWKLIGFNVIPASYFDDTQTSSSAANITAYSEYAEAVVRNYLGVNAKSYGVLDQETDVAGTDYLVDTDFSAIAGVDGGYTLGDATGNHTIFNQGSLDTDKRTIQARAIYLDIPPAGYLDNPNGYTFPDGSTLAAGTPFTAANVPLERIPFYETNVTSLVGWVPDEDQDDFGAGANYTSEHDTALQGGAVRDACQSGNITNTVGNCISNQELTNKSFGDFERGMIHPYVVTATPLTVKAKFYTGVDSLIDETINSESTIETSVDVTVQ